MSRMIVSGLFAGCLRQLKLRVKV